MLPMLPMLPILLPVLPPLLIIVLLTTLEILLALFIVIKTLFPVIKLKVVFPFAISLLPLLILTILPPTTIVSRIKVSGIIVAGFMNGPVGTTDVTTAFTFVQSKIA